MAATGAKLPGTGSSVARGTNTAWTNPGNITAIDSTVASCNAGTTGSAYLRASNFSFGIPANSVINGITAIVNMAESSAGTETVSVQLVDNNSTLFGTAKTFTANGTALTDYTLGTATDKWGATLSQTIVSSSNFGVQVWYTTTHNTTVDYITINIDYTPPATGTLAVTETGSDTAAMSGKVTVSGTLAVTETGSDTAAFSGIVREAGVSGTLAATETGSDTASLSGKVTIKGSLAATESGADTANISGKVLVSGTFAAQESGNDTAALQGKVLISGTLSAQESGEDTAAFSGTVLISGSLDGQEIGNDTARFAESSGSAIFGTLDATESGQDTASFIGTLPKPTPVGIVGGSAPGPRKSIKLAAQRILGLMAEVKPTKAVQRITKKLEEVLVQEEPKAEVVETLVTQAITEFTRQQSLAEYVMEIQNIRSLITKLKVIKQSLIEADKAKKLAKKQAEQDDEEALLLLT